MTNKADMVPCVKTGAQVILSRVPITQKVAECAHRLGWISTLAYKKLISKKDRKTQDSNISHGVTNISKEEDDFARKTKHNCDNFKENKTPLCCNSVSRKRKRNESRDDKHLSPSSSALQTHRGGQLKKPMVNEPAAAKEKKKYSTEINENSSKGNNDDKVNVFDEESVSSKGSSSSTCSVQKSFQMQTSDIAEKSDVILGQVDRVTPSVHTEAVVTELALESGAKVQEKKKPVCSTGTMKDKIQSECGHVKIPNQRTENLYDDIERISDGNDLNRATRQDQTVVMDGMQSNSENVQIPEENQRNNCDNIKKIDIITCKDLLGATSQNQEVIRDKIHSDCENVKNQNNFQENSCDNIERINSVSDLLGAKPQELKELMRDKVKSDCENLQKSSQNQEIGLDSFDGISTGEDLCEAMRKNLEMVRDEMQSNCEEEILSDCENVQTSIQSQEILPENLERISTDKHSSETAMQNLEMAREKRKSNCENIQTSDQSRGNRCFNIERISVDEDSPGVTSDDQELEQQLSKKNTESMIGAEEDCTSGSGSDAIKMDIETLSTSDDDVELVCESETNEMDNIEATKQTKAFAESLSDDLWNSFQENVVEDGCSLEAIVDKTSRISGGKAQALLNEWNKTDERTLQELLRSAMLDSMFEIPEIQEERKKLELYKKKLSNLEKENFHLWDMIGNLKNLMDDLQMGVTQKNTRGTQVNMDVAIKNIFQPKEGENTENISQVPSRTRNSNSDGVVTSGFLYDDSSSDGPYNVYRENQLDESHQIGGSKCNQDEEPENGSVVSEKRTNENVPNQSPHGSGVIIKKEPQDEVESENSSCEQNSCSTAPTLPTGDRAHHGLISSSSASREDAVSSGTVSSLVTPPCYTLSAMQQVPQPQVQPGVQQCSQQLPLGSEVQNQLQSQSNAAMLLHRQQQDLSAVQLQQQYPQQYPQQYQHRQLHPQQLYSQQLASRNVLNQHHVLRSSCPTGMVRQQFRPSHTGPASYLASPGTVTNSGQMHGFYTNYSLQHPRMQQMRPLGYLPYRPEQMGVQSSQSQSGERKTSPLTFPVSLPSDVSKTVNTVATDTTKDNAGHASGFKSNNPDVPSSAVAKSRRLSWEQERSAQQKLKLQRQRALAYQRYKQEQRRVLQQRSQQEASQSLQPVLPTSSTNSAAARNVETEGTGDKKDSPQAPSMRILMLTPPSTPSSVSPSDSVDNPVNKSSSPSLVNPDKTPGDPQMSSAKVAVVTSQIETQGYQSFSHREDPRLPPKPNISVALVQGKVVLTWNISKVALTPIAKYEILSYIGEDVVEVGDQPWRCIGVMLPTSLPMVCSLTEFEAGLTYYFAVRAVDIFGRLGPLSSPKRVIVSESEEKKKC